MAAVQRWRQRWWRWRWRWRSCPATFDSDPNTMSGTDVPLSATTSSAGAMEFVKRVAATSDNSAEPIRVGDAVLATSDTDEPDPSI